MKITFADRAKVAGRELVHGNLGNAAKAFTAGEDSFVINPATYASDDFGNGMWWFGNDGCDRYFAYEDATSSLNAYKRCPPVAAILNKQAQAFSNGKTWLSNTQGKARNNEAKGEVANKIRTLLNKPNYIQSGQQFESQVYMMRKLFGRAVILVDKPVGYSAIDADALWVLPNWMLTFYESQDLFFRSEAVITRVQLRYKNKTVDLPLDNLVFINDFTPSLDSVAAPQSRIQALQMPINNIIGAYESRNVLIYRRGPQYVISNGQRDKVSGIPLMPDEKKKLEQDFTLKYGLSKKQSQAIITSAAIDVQTIGFDVSQLKLHEEVRESAIDICNGLSFPPFLLGLSDSTYNNQAEASRGLYMETIIPEAQSISSQWNEIFKCADYKIELSKDFSHVSALQEDRTKQATARKSLDDACLIEFKNNLITLNQWRIFQDLDVVDEKAPDGVAFGDKYYYQLLLLGWQFGDSKPAQASQSTVDNQNLEVA